MKPITMTFPERLHEIIQDPEKEARVQAAINAEVMKEYANWRDEDPAGKEDIKATIHMGAMCVSANLLCSFMGLLVYRPNESQLNAISESKTV